MCIRILFSIQFYIFDFTLLIQYRQSCILFLHVKFEGNLKYFNHISLLPVYLNGQDNCCIQQVLTTGLNSPYICGKIMYGQMLGYPNLTGYCREEFGKFRTFLTSNKCRNWTVFE